MQISSRPLVVVLGVGLALTPAACSTLTGSGGGAAKNSPSDSTVFRTITVELQTSTTKAPASSGGATGGSGAVQTTLDPNIYEVKPGDSWYGIARKLKVDVNALLAANNASTRTVLLPGRRIAKPGAGSTAGGLAPPAPGGASSGGAGSGQTTPTLAPGSASGSYQIQAGDSWYGIANKLHVSVNALLEANSATTRTVLLVGKYLKVPQG